MNRQGQFITIEGTEGVGKSTQLEYVADYFRLRGTTVVTTREPGGTPVAEQIREILLQSEAGAVSDRCELLLMFAARASHLDQVVLPALQRGDWVVCDRFIDATYAYQGGGRGIADSEIAALEIGLMGSLTPDLTILLDAPPEVTEQRRQSRGLTDRFEQEQIDFFARVRAKYREIAAGHPARVKLVDAGEGIEAVQRSLAIVLQDFIDRLN